MEQLLKWKTAITGTIIYLFGLIAVHANLLRYGISEISALEIHYILVGSLIVLSLIPSLIVILVIEVWLAKRFTLIDRLFIIFVVFMVVLVSVGLFFRFEIMKLVLNMRSYPYPPNYPLNNLLVGNIVLILLWVIAFLLKVSRASKDLTKFTFPIATTGFLLVYVILFGRTIYPAIDHGVWGGSPQFAEIETQDKKLPCLLLHQSSTGFYYLDLTKIPDDLANSSSLTQYTLIQDSPVQQAVKDNQVNLIPLSRLNRLKIYEMNQRKLYERYIEKHRHLFP